MSQGHLDLQAAAEAVGISPSTLRNWSSRLPLPVADGPDGQRAFPPEALAVLETVKHLRADDRSYETIRRVIAPVPMPTHGLADPLETQALALAQRRISELEEALRVLGQDRDRLARALAEAHFQANSSQPRRSWWRGLAGG